jgi:hypothetical protein
VKPELEVVEIAADPRQIFWRHAIPLPYRPAISDADRAEIEDGGLNAPRDGEMASPRLRICGGFEYCMYVGVCFLRDSG